MLKLIAFLVPLSLLCAEDAQAPKPQPKPVDSALSSDFFKFSAEKYAIEARFEASLTEDQRKMRANMASLDRSITASYKTIQDWCAGQQLKLDEAKLAQQDVMWCGEKPAK